MGLTFADRCRRLPPSGGGGCHPALLGACNAGVREGLTDEQIMDTLREHLDDAARPISDKEIIDTLRTARATDGQAPAASRTAWAHSPAVKPGLIRDVISLAPLATATDLVIMSRVPLSPDPQQQTIQHLTHLFRPGERVFIGPAMAGGPEYLAKRTETGVHATQMAPWYIVNPLTGRAAQKRNSEGLSYRCDAAVSDPRYMLWEMDGVPVVDQIRFWVGVIRSEMLPVASVVMSGGKSVHALIRVDCRTPEEWDRRVRGELLARIAVPLGADRACGNPSRMSRLAGQQEQGRGVQWLLYLG